MEANGLVNSPEEIGSKGETTTATFMKRKAIISTRTGLVQTQEAINDLKTDDLTPKIPQEKPCFNVETVLQETKDGEGKGMDPAMFDTDFPGERKSICSFKHGVFSPPLLKHKALRKQRVRKKDGTAKMNRSRTTDLNEGAHNLQQFKRNYCRQLTGTRRKNLHFLARRCAVKHDSKRRTGTLRNTTNRIVRFEESRNAN